MGVVVRISAYMPASIDPPQAFREAFDRVAAVSQRFSSYDDASELRQVEQMAWQGRTPVSAEFARLLGHGLRLARLSGGAFDPTLGSVTRLLRTEGWGSAGPPESELREAWSRTGWAHVHLSSPRLEVSVGRRGLQFDLGGIAKGYAADEALAALRRIGVRQAVVAVAGDIAVGDPPPTGGGWQIGLDGLGPRGSIERSVTVSNQGVSTSGSRERFYRQSGRRCSHIIKSPVGTCTDPSLAVTVVAPTALEADGLATALISLGKHKDSVVLNGRSDIAVHWNSSDFRDKRDDQGLVRPGN